MKEDSEYNLFKSIVTDISKREIYWKYYEQRINHNIRIDIMFPHLKEKEKEYRNLIKIHNLSKDRLVKIYGLKHKRVKDIDSKIGNINKELYNIRNKIREIKKNLDSCYND